jgi:hypothetical protein
VYEGEPDVQNGATVPDVQDMPPQEELLANNGLLTKYEYSRSGNMMTSKTETTDIAKMLAYMDEAYKSAVPETTPKNAPQKHDIPSQMGDEYEPTANLEREEPNVRENPHSIDETYQEEDVANHEQTNGVANKKEYRGSP